MEVIIKRIMWSLRRLNLRIPHHALVLEVGSGGNPYPRANVLLDAYEETRERHWDALVHDRQTVLSFGENLPFKDKAFDYVIAAHVLEHTPYPEKFLAELQRVARAGYIETPDAFMERINPYRDHRLEVTVRDDGLVIRKKPAWIYDADLVELYEDRAKSIITRETIPWHADDFHMRYFWQDTIKYTIINPEVDAAWVPPFSLPDLSVQKMGKKAIFRLLMLNIIRRMFSQNSRNAKLDIVPLMRCPKCYLSDLKRASEYDIFCRVCGVKYKIDRNIYHVY
ncbi:MAG: methyltransferase domain-containing protein [Magnetococcales bacterium]|nr:methyltransferase domain-containing protein [Magnetococcales bacterium]